MNTFLSENEKTEFLSFFSSKEILFQTLVNMGRIILVNGPHDTAWVTFDREGQYLNFYFNQKFWDSLCFYERAFIIGHECLHVLLCHGARIRLSQNKMFANIAADLVVNHLLISRFDFDISQIPISEKLCWRENIFVNNEKKIKLPNENSSTYEIYYKILIENNESFCDMKLESIDEHNGSCDSCNDSLSDDKENKETENKETEKKEISMEEMTDEEVKEFFDKTLDEIIEKNINNFVSKTEKDLPSENTYGPNPYSSHLTDAKGWKRKESYSWKKIFAKVSKDALKISDKEHLQWIRKSRRNNLLPKDLILPHEVDVEEMKKDKLSIQLYIDFSGSCRHLEKDFWLAYDSIPKKLYDIDLYTYSDVIYSVDKKDKKMKGTYGNAPFQIIENNIQKLIKEKKLKKYPHCIVVFTDGHAGGVKPFKPQNWIWILPKANSTKQWLPTESKKIWLEDIENNRP